MVPNAPKNADQGWPGFSNIRDKGSNGQNRKEFPEAIPHMNKQNSYVFLFKIFLFITIIRFQNPLHYHAGTITWNISKIQFSTTTF